MKNCTYCDDLFKETHFNQKLCSPECKSKSRADVLKRYDKSEKGKISRDRWVKSERCKANEKRYASTPKARRAAVLRITRYLKKYPYARERKRARDRLYGKTEKGRAVNAAATLKYRKTEAGKIIRLLTNHRRREIVRNGNVFPKEWTDRLLQYNGCCAFCGSSESIEVDHIIPLSRGGKHCIENVQPLCRSCNAKKSDKIL